MQRKLEVSDWIRAVKLADGFWRSMVDRTLEITLPHVLEKCEEEGHIRNVQIAAGLSQDPYSGGSDRDSDLFKAMEGAAYGLVLSPGAGLERQLDRLIELVASAQQPDGYLQTYYTSQKPEERYADLQRSHELYCAGHLIEAAVAHHLATGNSPLLAVATKLADHLVSTFGPGKLEKAPGHQEVELALFRLYRETGDTRYRDLGKYFVDLRGNRDMVKREYSGKLIIEGDRWPGRNRPPEYRQDHLPAVEQREAIGHAVRAGYLYAAMADIAMEYDSREYAEAAKAIWDDVVGKKLYLSGGVGTHQYHDEGYGDAYLLPNTGYCETCGGVAFMLFSHRMGLLTGEAKYADIVERILYNHVLSSMDLSGRLTFYRNPLSSQAPRSRPDWNHPACCPANTVRILPQFSRLIYTTAASRVYVDQFAASAVELSLADGRVRICQETDYPWSGRVVFAVEPGEDLAFALHIRIPGWVDGRPVPSDLYSSPDRAAVTIRVNGETVDTVRDNGYCVIERTWTPGDRVVLELSMPVQRVYAHPLIEADRGRVALMRGPLLYCFEEADLGTDPEAVVVPPTTQFTATHRPDFLGGVTVLSADTGELKAVPFAVWNNREPGRMAVWMKEKE